MKGLILAGGSGTRLWPLSREDAPKQFLKLGEEGSLLEQTAHRLSSLETLVIANEKHRDLVEEQVKSPVLIEPAARSTAPAVALGLKYWLENGAITPDDVCVVTPSDLYFENEEDFLRLLPSAEQGAQQGAIVTFGVVPTYPEIGYGYIKTLEGKGILQVERFVEKPEFETAVRLIENGHYYWNAGIFVFQVGYLIQEFQKHASEIAEWMERSYEEALLSFSALPKISFDHAIMEKTNKILLIPYPSVWSDLGSWDRLDAALPKDAKGNYMSGKIEAVDSEDCLVFGDDIVTLGVKELVVVKYQGKVVVCSKKELHRLSHLQTETY